jgi:hypothetical protein
VPEYRRESHEAEAKWESPQSAAPSHKSPVQSSRLFGFDGRAAADLPFSQKTFSVTSFVAEILPEREVASNVDIDLVKSAI